MSDPYSLYIHIPFCQVRCTYCAFNTYADMDDYQTAYVEALIKEIVGVGQAAPGKLPVHTIYFGGGTPSLLAPQTVQRILDTCREYYSLAPDSEITLEANPGTVDYERLAGYRGAGVTRLSLGVQSSHAGELAMFGRLHSYEEAVATYHIARKVGFNSINLDFIYGLPGQSLQSWQETVQSALAWEPDHLSLYSLSLEPGTPLRHEVDAGQRPYPDPDLAADMYDDARDALSNAGYEHYEISNWARPGHASRHNIQYWRSLPFLGFGAGAHGAVGAMRYWNTRPIPDYIQRLTVEPSKDRVLTFPHSPALYDFEQSDARTEQADALILGLRLLQEGVKEQVYADRFGQSPSELYGPLIDTLIEEGLLSREAGILRLTPRAYLLSNRVFTRFIPEHA